MGPPLTGTERVLVRLPSWLGDFVMSEPALRALERRLERGALTLVGLAPHLELLAGRLPRARHIALAARDGDDHRLYRGHDVALLFTGSFRSAWCALRARIPRRIGFARDGRGCLLTDAVMPARERGATPLEIGCAGSGRRWLPRPLARSLAELLGLVGVPVSHLQPRLDVPPEALSAARARRVALGLDPAAPFLLANVGARPGSAKGVPAAIWAGALRALRRAGERMPVVLAAGPGEEHALEAVRAELGQERAHVLRYPPAALPELLAHCSAARCLWSGDTGPRHLARALSTPAVIVGGPTDPRHCGVSERERVVRLVVPCGPCHRERCPLAGEAHQRCMTGLDPAEIAAATHELLATIRG